MRLLLLLIVSFSSYVVSEEHELSEVDRKNCFKFYLPQSNNNVFEFNFYNESTEKCNNTVKVEAEKFDNKLLTIIKGEQKINNCTYCKECMMKFIKDFKVSDVALKDKTYDNGEDTILNKDVTNLLLRISYFYCYPNDLFTIIFEMDFQFGHWKDFSLKVIEKEICLFMDAIQVFDVNDGFTLSSCGMVIDQVVDQSALPSNSIAGPFLLFMFSQDENQYDRSLSLATIESCLMTKFEEKGYIDNKTYYSKIENQNYHKVYKTIQEAAKMSFQLPMMLVAKLAQCFLYDILDEDFLYESLFHVMQPDFIEKEKKKDAKEKLIKFVKTTLQNYVNCLVNVEWKIGTFLVYYKYIKKAIMKKVSDQLNNENYYNRY